MRTPGSVTQAELETVVFGLAGVVGVTRITSLPVEPDRHRFIPHHAVIWANKKHVPKSTSTTCELVPEPDSTGYQFIQARGMILIKSEIGLVAVLPIGMAQGDWVEKGQENSFLQLGGSDIVTVFQKDANVQLDQEKGVQMGQLIWKWLIGPFASPFVSEDPIGVITVRVYHITQPTE